MKRSTLIVSLFTLLLAGFVVPVNASVSVEGSINDNFYVVYNLESLNSTIYDGVKTNQQFNISTIPTIIVKNLENQGYKQVKWGFGPQTDIFNDTARAIHVSFYLGGLDLISFIINRTTMRRTYQVKTDWRKFQLNLTSSFSIDFAKYFAAPVAEWQKTDYTDNRGNKHPAYYYKANETSFLDAMSFYFILPATATNTQTEADTITFEVPPYFEDVFLNSPFLILAVLIVVIIIVLIYRRVR